jgi:hypothetical protein
MLNTNIPSDGDLIEKHEGAILLDVPLDDRTNSVWLDNGWNQWNGFPSYKKPKGKNWCTGS